MKNLTSSKYWSEKHPAIEKAILDQNFHNLEFLYPMLDKYFKMLKGGSIVEFGCVPGQGLYKVSDRYGLVPHGVDFVKEIDIVAAIFRKHFPKSSFQRADLSKDKVKGQFDITMSGGLIEHFDDVEDIVKKHIAATKPGGIVFLNTPNLSFWRAFFWRVFDPALLRGHNPRATDLKYVSGILKRNGCELLDVGYFGDPHIWIENTKVRGSQKATNYINRKLEKTKRKSATTMPFVYWIARKTEEVK